LYFFSALTKRTKSQNLRVIKTGVAHAYIKAHKKTLIGFTRHHATIALTRMTELAQA